MERNVDINEISDGKRYSINDMVKIGCSDCKGCHKCCMNVDGLIALDPYDIYRLINGLRNGLIKDSAALDGLSDISFNSLLDVKIEFTMDRGVLIPTLKMKEKDGGCAFLSENGRCSVHDIRPGICRLFPMGRIYEDSSFSYFLQKDECEYKGKTKVKLKNWIDTKDVSKYEKYICDWHYFIKDIQKYLDNADDDEVKQVNSALIQMFFVKEYGDDFYSDFYERLNKVREVFI